MIMNNMKELAESGEARPRTKFEPSTLLLYKKEEIDQLGVNGAVSIAELAGYLKKSK